MALFKSAENDYLLFGNVSPPSRALQLLLYLKVLAALARAGAPSGLQASTTVQKRWWGQDSNLCSPFGRRFYRPLPLTARPPHPGARQLANFTSRLLTRARPALIHPLNSRAAPT